MSIPAIFLTVCEAILFSQFVGLVAYAGDFRQLEIGIIHITTRHQTKSEAIGSSDIVDHPQRSKDRSPMVLIPAGSFTMGSWDVVGGLYLFNDAEKPTHEVQLDSYFIDQFEITTSQYAQFIQGTNRKPPDYWEQVMLSLHSKKPIVGVTWFDAKDYCEWAGKRLPTEAEWEKAARGNDERKYPWGTAQPNSTLAQYSYDHNWKKNNLYTYAIKEIDEFEAGKSPYNIYNMAGNVWEWTNDWFDLNYYRHSPLKNPQGPSAGTEKVIRGGAWTHGPNSLRTSVRHGVAPSGRGPGTGFRCAKDVP